MDRSAATPSPPVPPKPHFFIPCLQGFRRQLRRYWNGRLALGAGSAAGSWARLPVYADFEATCIVAARAFMHLQHHAQYREHGLATPSPVATRLTVGAIRVRLGWQFSEFGGGVHRDESFFHRALPDFPTHRHMATSPRSCRPTCWP